MIIELLLCAIQVFAQEKSKLSDGTEFFEYQSNPPIKAQQKCESYAVIKRNKGHEFLENGIKKDSRSNVFLVRNGCIFPFTGNLELMNGRAVDFYQEKAFNDDGELAFWSGTLTPLPNGSYQTKKGTKFDIESGRIDNYGYFEKDDINFEDRN